MDWEGKMRAREIQEVISVALSRIVNDFCLHVYTDSDSSSLIGENFSWKNSDSQKLLAILEHYCNIKHSKVGRFHVELTSAGPLITERQGGEKQFEQIGVVSFGEGCGEKEYPGVYARVTAQLDWIKREMEGETCA